VIRAAAAAAAVRDFLEGMINGIVVVVVMSLKSGAEVVVVVVVVVVAAVVFLDAEEEEGGGGTDTPVVVVVVVVGSSNGGGGGGGIIIRGERRAFGSTTCICFAGSGGRNGSGACKYCTKATPRTHVSSVPSFFSTGKRRIFATASLSASPPVPPRRTALSGATPDTLCHSLSSSQKMRRRSAGVSSVVAQ